MENIPLATFVSDSIPFPLVSFKLKGEIPLVGRFVNCEPSPINEAAVTDPAIFVVPSKSTVKASDLSPVKLPPESHPPLPITKALFV